MIACGADRLATLLSRLGIPSSEEETVTSLFFEQKQLLLLLSPLLYSPRHLI